MDVEDTLLCRVNLGFQLDLDDGDCSDKLREALEQYGLAVAQFLKEIEPKFQNELDQGYLSAEVQQAFKDKRLLLSQNARLLEGRKVGWRIVDETQQRMYRITREKKSLRIYSLVQNVTVEEKGSAWLINGWGQLRYSIRREREHLAIYGSIFWKHGQYWTPKEIRAVFEWLDHKRLLDKFVQFAYGFTRELDLAEKVVQDKVGDAFCYLHTYDPTRYRGKKSPFLNWLYYMIARAVIREIKKNREEEGLDGSGKPPGGAQPPGTDDSAEMSSCDPDELLVKLEAKINRIWKEIQPYLNQLLPKYQDAIELCFKQGWSRVEAAQKSRPPCSVAAMKVRLHRACQEFCKIAPPEMISALQTLKVLGRKWQLLYRFKKEVIS